ncbi:unnamed protein product [Phytophthora fragariaefolia]|uniref:Unnamed protein product n=1 Tax=Phytophthora fragariaefolia TaxID=1490495 RepID=A0A9W6Y4H4_9STRA|nr:unnamed protein product [Phytophthora fragariaefolia]
MRTPCSAISGTAARATQRQRQFPHPLAMQRNAADAHTSLLRRLATSAGLRWSSSSSSRVISWRQDPLVSRAERVSRLGAGPRSTHPIAVEERERHDVDEAQHRHEDLHLDRLSGHQSAVESIVFDPAERKVVAGSQAGSIKVFDLEAGKVNRTLKGHMASTTTVDYHLYGDYVASGSRDTIVKVWDLRTKSCMQTFKGHASEVTAVSFTPDGRWLTSGDQDGVIKIWDLTTGRLLHEFPDHGGAITSLEFNPEEFILVSSAADRTVRFWDVQEFALIGVTPVDNATVRPHECTTGMTNSNGYLMPVMMPRQKDLGYVEIHADTTMTQDMKLMGGCIQDAFVSVWVLDVMQMRPFNRKNDHSNDHTAAEARSSNSRPASTRAVTPKVSRPVERSVAQSSTSIPTEAPVVTGHSGASQGSVDGSNNFPNGRGRARTPVLREVREPGCPDAVSNRPTTPGVLVSPFEGESIPRPVRRADESRKSGTVLGNVLLRAKQLTI